MQELVVKVLSTPVQSCQKEVMFNVHFDVNFWDESFIRFASSQISYQLHNFCPPLTIYHATHYYLTALSSPEGYGDHKNQKSAENQGNKRDQENAGGQFPVIFSDSGTV